MTTLRLKTDTLATTRVESMSGSEFVRISTTSLKKGTLLELLDNTLDMWTCRDLESGRTCHLHRRRLELV